MTCVMVEQHCRQKCNTACHRGPKRFAWTTQHVIGSTVNVSIKLDHVTQERKVC